MKRFRRVRLIARYLYLGALIAGVWRVLADESISSSLKTSVLVLFLLGIANTGDDIITEHAKEMT